MPKEAIGINNNKVEKKAEVKLESISEQERNRLILENLGLVKAIAGTIHKKIPIHVELEDLIHNGILGLIDAVGKYDPEKNLQFGTYATTRIRGAILDGLREADSVKRGMRNNKKKVDRATEAFVQRFQRKPTEQELADDLGITLEQLRRIVLDLRHIGTVSASTLDKNDEDLLSPDFIENKNTHPDNIFLISQLGADLDRAIKDARLNERYKQVLRLLYVDGLSMKEAGLALSPPVIEARVSQMNKIALEKLQKAFRIRGVNSPRDYGVDGVLNKNGSHQNLKI